jgi:hypothetical protein
MVGEVDWDELVRDEMDWAIKERRRVKGEEEFVMRVRIVGPHGELANTPLVWRDEQEKRSAMRALSFTCKITGAQAAVIVSDTRWLDVPGFCKCFNIPEPDFKVAGQYEEFEARRREIMPGFDWYMGNLPSECWKEALMVAVHGPKVKRLEIIEYRHDGDRLIFQDKMGDKDLGKVEIPMLPKWWE